MTEYGPTSWIFVNIGSGNGMLPDGTKPLHKSTLVYCQWDAYGIETKFCEVIIHIHTFIQENVFEFVVCETAAILFKPECVAQTIFFKYTFFNFWHWYYWWFRWKLVLFQYWLLKRQYTCKFIWGRFYQLIQFHQLNRLLCDPHLWNSVFINSTDIIGNFTNIIMINNYIVSIIT